MRKITKLSLVTIMTLTSVTSANAQNIVEALKNVDVSGTAAYRYNDYEASGSTNLLKIAANLKSQVNEDITFNSRIIAGDKTNSGEHVLDSSQNDKNIEPLANSITKSS